MRGFANCVLACALAAAMSARASGQSAAGQKVPPANAPTQAAGADNSSNQGGLTIEPQELPEIFPYAKYEVVFHARGSHVPVVRWTVEKGALPPGLRLEESGVLHGMAQRTGEFQFVIAVKDSGLPPQTARKAFVMNVEAFNVVWKVPAHVNVNRIEGSVDVTNMTADEIDLTFDVKAVAENGRATEIGYQHFPLKTGTIAMTLPFGENLPHGAYLVRVDVVGEVARRKAIYRQGLQMPERLQVVPGP